MKKRLHIKFAGRVQGVGFRFTAEAIASQLNITGWAKNLNSGGVEIVAEGEEGALEGFVSNLEEQFSGYIADREISWESPTSEFEEFGIRF
ncbi:MAG TPA: acylphosphatase [Candidatus Omnitrophica bacterium]|nr:acylphosphatase [Candidatus Omnitrophota bacterium]